jgi:hypothetical protein
MTDTLTALTAAVLLALTVPGQAATPQDNLQAIERLAERQQRGIERAAVHAVHVAPEPQHKPDTTLQMTPAEIAYEQARPWMLIRKPWRGAVRVRGGWLIHESSDYAGFYRSVTEAEATQLRNNR